LNLGEMEKNNMGGEGEGRKKQGVGEKQQSRDHWGIWGKNKRVNKF